MKINNKENFRLIYLAALIFSIKPLEFLAVNISVANFKDDLIYPVIFHLLIFLIFLFIFILFLSLKNKLINMIFIFLASAYYLQYFTLDIRDSLIAISPVNLNVNIYLLVSICLILLISIIFTKIYFLSKNKKLILAGVSFLCLIQIFILANNSFFLLNKGNNDPVFSSSDVNKLEESSDISGENVYYIILDGLISYEYFLENSDVENNDFSNFNIQLQNKDFTLFEDSLSSYNITFLTLGSILEMNYYDKDLKYSNRDNFFPKLLYKNDPPELIKSLNKIGYDFIYSGNFWAQCKQSIHFSCANRKIDIEALNFYQKLINYTNNAGIQTLTSRSLIGYVLRFIYQYSGSSFYDDGLENFLESGIEDIEPKSKKFYFIHNESPHPPYPEQNCKIDHTKSYTGWIDMPSYSFSISCALDKALYSINKIIEIDPSAIIVIQGDHGTSLNYDWMSNPLIMSKSNLKERFSIYNSIRLPKRCSQINNGSLGNVETVNLVFDCISNNVKSNLSFKNRSFAAVYEDNREYFGKVYDVSEILK